MLGHYGDEAAIYAGGTELLLAMRHRALSYSHLIDLKVIPGLNAIEARDGVIEIGAACTHRAIERSALVREKQPVLAELESQVANIRVRATGTLGGNLCFAEPHSDPATMLLVLGATVRIESADGTREIPIEKLIAGAYANHLAPGEILTRIVVPSAKSESPRRLHEISNSRAPHAGPGTLARNSRRRAHLYSGSRCRGLRLSISQPRIPAERLLTGPRAEVEKRLPEAAALIADGADLVDDHEGSAEYKRHLIGVFLRRTFRKAVAGDAAKREI